MPPTPLYRSCYCGKADRGVASCPDSKTTAYPPDGAGCDRPLAQRSTALHARTPHKKDAWPKMPYSFSAIDDHSHGHWHWLGQYRAGAWRGWRAPSSSRAAPEPRQGIQDGSTGRAHEQASMHQVLFPYNEIRVNFFCGSSPYNGFYLARRNTCSRTLRSQHLSGHNGSRLNFLAGH